MKNNICKENQFQRNSDVYRQIDKFISHERDIGFKPLTIKEHLYKLIAFDHWLTIKNISISQLSSRHVDRFIKFRKIIGYTGRSGRGLLERFLTYLKEKKIIESITSLQPPPSPQQQIIQRFALHLENDRGYSKWTIVRYTHVIDAFLTMRFKKKVSTAIVTIIRFAGNYY